MKKRIICAALILTLTIGASGCGLNEATYKTEDVYVDSPTYKSDAYGAAAGDEAGAVLNGDVEAAAEYDGGDIAKSAALDGELSVADGLGDTVRGVGTDGTPDESTEKDLPEAGQLTAGMWNDNENWGFFSNLVNSGTIAFPAFGIDPTHRTEVTVKAPDGTVIPNAKANLLDKSGAVIWSGTADKNGVVYLFGEGESVEVEVGGKKQSYALTGASGNEQQAKKTAAAELEAVFDGKGEKYEAMDIMFIVDTTGSMYDEMLFLQSEFTAITEEIGTNKIRYSVNFYRDEGDDYVTKCNDFTSNVKQLQKQLNKEDADGGGDYPEAVAQALTETMFSKDWKDDSVKLAFLIYDAPPHEGKEEELLAAVKEAAAKGIRLIPVVASDGDRDTELFGRAIAITTGGTYVFLTDDSGIGNSHEEPIIGSYEVKSLYDTIIEIVNDYKQ